MKKILVYERKKFMSKKLLSLLTGAIMTFSTVPFVANAEETTEKRIESIEEYISNLEELNPVMISDIKTTGREKRCEFITEDGQGYSITEYFNGPVFVTNWPKDIKAWYMKVNSDGKTVAAVDLEVPGAGELMGGSQREEDYGKLMTRVKEMGVDESAIEWYCNLRKYGTCVHSGFGMGFERLIIYLTGVDNIRDVIPYPRTPGNCDY